MKQIIIELPGVKAVSRNQTNGAYWGYHAQLVRAEQWMLTFGKNKEYHFETPVNVLVEAYYDCTGRSKIADSPNIDDKIFTDILIRWKKKKKGPAIERGVWFLEDDSPTYLESVTKRSIRSDQNKVVITITEAIAQI